MAKSACGCRAAAGVTRHGVGTLLWVLLAGAIAVCLLWALSGCGSETSGGGPETTEVATSSTPSSAPATSAEVSTDASVASSDDMSAVTSTQGAVASSVIPLGREADVGGWRVKVVDVHLNADEIVLNHSEFNESPQPGEQYVLIKVAAARTGEKAASFWADTTCVFVGGVGDTFEAGWADVPESMSETGEVSPGASVAGNLVFLVPSKQITGGVLGMNAAYSSVRFYFALD